MGRRWDDQAEELIPAEFTMTAKYVRLEGWNLVIHRRHVGQPWDAVSSEVFSQLTPGELVDVLDGVLGHWFEV